jgi:hypothetical protein
MSAQLAVGRLDELVERHATALQPDASCGDPPTPYPYASGQNRNGQPTFGELMASLQFLLADTLLMRFRLRCYGALASICEAGATASADISQLLS